MSNGHSGRFSRCRSDAACRQGYCLGRHADRSFHPCGMEAKNLKPAPAADKRTLLRRVTYDLVGLPPTPEEIDAFLKDNTPHAFDRVVESLLASPGYGERWGRHWLDIARYADF